MCTLKCRRQFSYGQEHNGLGEVAVLFCKTGKKDTVRQMLETGEEESLDLGSEERKRKLPLSSVERLNKSAKKGLGG